MYNEFFSAASGDSGAQARASGEPIPLALEGEFAELMLKSLIRGFHSTSVFACTPDGTVLVANDIAAAGFHGFNSESLVGVNLRDIAPRLWAEERIKFMNLAIERQRPLLVNEILGGTRLSTTISPIELPDEHPLGWVLLITVEHVTPLKLELLRSNIPPENMIDANVIDLGRLSVLSPRELEVVALMGQGLRQKQIAERLHRSVSTIDRHRERIGEKLGITDRIELVGLARDAVLEVKDASRTQVSFR